MKFGVVVFPGSNCEHDAYWIIKEIIKQDVVMLWHKERALKGVDAIILPGGFSYGDYLRTGAIARFSPIMNSVIEFAKKGKPVLGICNGFQILLESGLLKGALVTNGNLRFISQMVNVKVTDADSPFTNRLKKGQILGMPIAHGCGCYYADDDTIAEMEDEGRIALRYCNDRGRLTKASNPNTSLRNIAGIYNREKTVLGLMPHPERAGEAILGSVDGVGIFKSMVAAYS